MFYFFNIEIFSIHFLIEIFNYGIYTRKIISKNVYYVKIYFTYDISTR